MIITMILIFVLGYLCIALEHKLRIDKAAIALLMCGALWTVLSLLGNDAQIGTQLIEQLGDTSEILFFLIGASLTGGIRLETEPRAWLSILGLALPATALSNMALVQAIKKIGPTLTSVFGAMEPLTAVVIGITVFGEPFTWRSAAGIVLIVSAVLTVILRNGRNGV